APVAERVPHDDVRERFHPHVGGRHVVEDGRHSYSFAMSAALMSARYFPWHGLRNGSSPPFRRTATTHTFGSAASVRFRSSAIASRQAANSGPDLVLGLTCPVRTAGSSGRSRTTPQRVPSASRSTR